MMVMMILLLPLLLFSGGGVMDRIKKNDDEINDRRSSSSFMLLVSASASSSHLPLPKSSTSTVLHKELQLEEDAHQRPLQSISSLRLRRMSNKKNTTKTSYDNDQQHDNVDGGGVATATATADAAAAAATSMSEDDENKEEEDKDHKDEEEEHNVLNDHSKTVTMMNNQVHPLAYDGAAEDKRMKKVEKKETALLPPRDYEKTQFLSPHHNRHEEQLLLRSGRRKMQQALIQQPPYWIKLGDDIDGESRLDTSGKSISISDNGTVLAVSAPSNDGNGDNSGHVRVYHYNGTAWNQIGADIDGEAPFDSSGSSISLSGDGTTVAIGAYKNDGNSTVNSDAIGHVRVFKYIQNGSMGGNWTQLGDDIDGEAKYDNSGESVSLSRDGTVLAVGARYNDGAAGVDSGHVRVYQYVNNTWGQIGDDIDGEAGWNYFGSSLSMSSDGTVLAVGAPSNDGNLGTASNDCGHVRVYKYANRTWTQLGNEDINGEAAGDKSGISISLSSDGTVLAVGAAYNDGGIRNDDRGHVRVYKFNNADGNWTQLGADIDGEASNDKSGISVSLSGDGTVLAVGATDNDGTAGVTYDNRGHVRLFKYLNGNWTQLGADIDGEALRDSLGSSVSLSRDGTTVAVSAPSNDGAVLYSEVGHVRVYRATITTESPSYSPTHVPTTSTPSDSPTHMPTSAAPSKAPTNNPATANPSHVPSTVKPTSRPSLARILPTNKPISTKKPITMKPTKKKSEKKVRVTGNNIFR